MIRATPRVLFSIPSGGRIVSLQYPRGSADTARAAPPNAFTTEQKPACALAGSPGDCPALAGARVHSLTEPIARIQNGFEPYLPVGAAEGGRLSARGQSVATLSCLRLGRPHDGM